MSWTHPTGGQPKSIHLVGLGPSHRDYDQLWLNPDTPETLYQADEVWTVNRGVFNIQHDLLWCMDHIQGEADNFPIYGSRLWHHDKPIITSDNLEGWPGHVHAYPFGEIWTWLNTEFDPVPIHIDWIVNSIPFAILYAAWIGVKQVYGWGLDYHHHSSGRVEDGHPCLAYWSAQMERVGMKVMAPKTSTLFDSNNRAFFYGYQQDPRPGSAARRQQFRMLVGLDKGADDA